MRTRWKHAVVGASTGMLAAMALLLADIPGIPGQASFAFIAIVTIAGALVAALGATRIIAYGGVTVALCTAIVTMTPIVDGPVSSWIRRDPLPSAPLDAVVVLSSGVNQDGALDVSGIQRLESALAVSRQNHARLLITTRVEDRRGGRTVNSDSDQRKLIELGGDTSTWRIVSPVFTTHDEALRTAELLAPASARTIAVVTSPLHTRRSCLTFEKLGFHVVCIPSVERRYPVQHLSGPQARFIAFVDWLYEQLGMIKYRARGWV